jgi:hypothetical protein
VHVQPVPPRLVAVKMPPLGSESVTVTVPLVPEAVLLVPVIEYCPVPLGAKLPLCEMVMVQGIGAEILRLLPPHPPRSPARQVTQKNARANLSRFIPILQA